MSLICIINESSRDDGIRFQLPFGLEVFDRAYASARKRKQVLLQREGELSTIKALHSKLVHPLKFLNYRQMQAHRIQLQLYEFRCLFAQITIGGH